jgi:endoglucanase
MTRLTLRSDWGSGYCADVQVSNRQIDSLQWKISLTVSDSITTLLDAVYTRQDRRVIVPGAAWNSLLPPGQELPG